MELSPLEIQILIQGLDNSMVKVTEAQTILDVRKKLQDELTNKEKEADKAKE